MTGGQVPGRPEAGGKPVVLPAGDPVRGMTAGPFNESG